MVREVSRDSSGTGWVEGACVAVPGDNDVEPDLASDPVTPVWVVPLDEASNGREHECCPPPDEVDGSVDRPGGINIYVRVTDGTAGFQQRNHLHQVQGPRDWFFPASSEPIQGNSSVKAAFTKGLLAGGVFKVFVESRRLLFMTFIGASACPAVTDAK